MINTWSEYYEAVITVEKGRTSCCWLIIVDNLLDSFLNKKLLLLNNQIYYFRLTCYLGIWKILIIIIIIIILQ